MLEDTCIRGRRARIPWACGHEAETRTKTSLPYPYGGLILGSAAPSRDVNGVAAPVRPEPPLDLIRFPPLLLAQSLPRKRFFCPALLSGFHVEAMLLDFLDDVFLLHLALETAQSIFQRFTLLDDDFSHWFNSPPIRFGLVSCGASGRPKCRRLCTAAGTAPVADYRMYWPIRERTLIGRWHLLINSCHPSQGIFVPVRHAEWYWNHLMAYRLYSSLIVNKTCDSILATLDAPPLPQPFLSYPRLCSLLTLRRMSRFSRRAPGVDPCPRCAMPSEYSSREARANACGR